MACPVLIDLRNVYAGEDMAQHGFLYVGVGRPDSRELKRM
jgi:UDPglucose 6-dehydrogenase